MSYYPARAVVDHAAIRANVARLRAVAGAAEVMAVVKADAYGHGIVPVSRTALAAGATWLGVAQLGEALELRAAGIDAPLLTWIYGPGAPLAEALTANLDLSASAPWALDELATAARLTGRAARVHLKADTGMARGGARPEQWAALVDHAARLAAEGTVDVVGVWSHLARGDEPAEPTTATQLAAFHDAVATAERAGLRPTVRHLAASSGTLFHPGTRLDLVRPGLALYGLSPAPDVADAVALGLRAALRLEAEVIHVKDVPAATLVGYGHTYTTPSAGRLALVPLGYGDGIPRHAGNAGPVRIGAHRGRLAGRVSMDQVVVDLGPDGGDVSVGDLAVLLGDARDGVPTAQDWADAAGTISYEIVTRLGSRIPRTHVSQEDPR
ncbi:alanine racemase [Georgenia satyanarayanai]|uniref:Alanine racemase n=1 Tax=Georgenia satyanarayanai TaxID=860221 RepID=A0A2Y9ACN2_9MICO|nr:alanine racemase [Georgenia satyanarayanai]PYG00668.1 alanine racemase [Georgenia satyanarayanai]SSA40057.1 alanine racemase [Georgenia satyanarayanai]